jgi:hypothetical protein
MNKINVYVIELKTKNDFTYFRITCMDATIESVFRHFLNVRYCLNDQNENPTFDRIGRRTHNRRVLLVIL